MRFLIDAQLPPALAGWLGDRGLSASPVRQFGLRDSDDGSIWNFAIDGKWIVVTKDVDFVARCIVSDEAPPVVWLRIGNCTNRVLFKWLDPRWENIRTGSRQEKNSLKSAKKKKR